MTQDDSHEDGTNPSANKSLNRLFRRDLDKWSAAKGDTAKIGEDIVSNDQCRGHKEPENSWEDVANNKVALNNYQQQRHMRNAELSELELVVVLLEGETKRQIQ